MITGIAIENIGGFSERVDVELKPLTLLFGPNSAGRSAKKRIERKLRECKDAKLVRRYLIINKLDEGRLPRA